MAQPPTIAQIDAAIPPDGEPDRALTNSLMRDFLASLGGVPTNTLAQARALTLAAGSQLRLSDVGATPAGSLFVSDGTNVRPQNGSTSLLNLCGSVATPLSTYTGGTGGVQLVIPGGNPKIPASLLLPGSRLKVEGYLRHRGSGNCTFAILLGTAQGFNANSNFVNRSLGGDGNAASVDMDLLFPTSGRATTSSYTPKNQANGNIYDSTYNVNTAADMYLSLEIPAGSMVAADSLDLISLSITLFQ